MIQRIDIVTSAGAKSYILGEKVNDKIVDHIRIVPLYFQGDPYDHYVGYTNDGDKIFSINCLAPCVVEYL